MAVERVSSKGSKGRTKAPEQAFPETAESESRGEESPLVVPGEPPKVERNSHPTRSGGRDSTRKPDSSDRLNPEPESKSAPLGGHNPSTPEEQAAKDEVTDYTVFDNDNAEVSGGPVRYPDYVQDAMDNPNLVTPELRRRYPEQFPAEMDEG